MSATRSTAVPRTSAAETSARKPSVVVSVRNVSERPSRCSRRESAVMRSPMRANAPRTVATSWPTLPKTCARS